MSVNEGLPHTGYFSLNVHSTKNKSASPGSNVPVVKQVKHNGGYNVYLRVTQ